MEERTRRILATAVELAEKGGFEAVRLRDVAADSGVALGTLYRRFRSKEELLLAALEVEIEDLRSRFGRRPAEGGDALERLEAFFRLTTRALLRRPNLARALLRSLATGEPTLTPKVADFHETVGALIVTAVRGPGASPRSEPSTREREVSFALQQVWFASLIGWSAGLHPEEEIVGHTRSAAALLLSGGA